MEEFQHNEDDIDRLIRLPKYTTEPPERSVREYAQSRGVAPAMV